MLPLALFGERNFAGANLLTFLLYAALGGGLFFFPLNLIQVQGYGATFAGAALLPFIAIMFVLSRWAGRLVDRFGSKLPLVVGPSIAAVGFALFAATSIGGNYWTTFFPAVCVLGLGMSITVAPLTTTVMNAAGEDRAGIASGVNNAVSRVAGLLALAVFGIVLSRAFDGTLVREIARIGPPPEVVALLLEQRHRFAGMSLPSDLPEPMRVALRAAVGTAFVSGFRRIMLLCSVLALSSALIAGLRIDGRRVSNGEARH